MNSTAKESLLLGMDLRPEFVMLDICADNRTQALEQLANTLLQEGMVKPDFPSAIVEREEEYCTGLAFEEMGIAIPHTTPNHVINPCIAIGVPTRPITFRSMGTPNIPCETEMIFMLAITDPDMQLDFLQTFMHILQTPGRLRDLKACKTQENLTSLFKSYFINC